MAEVKSPRDRLVFLSLAILADAADNAGAEPCKPNLAVRLALAYLYSIAGGDRGRFDDFWKTLSKPLPTGWSDTARNYYRRTYCRTHLTAIARGVGVELTVEAWARLRRS